MADEEQGEPVDYDPFPEDKTHESMQKLMESMNSHANVTAKIQMEMAKCVSQLAQAMESLAASQKGLARALLAPRHVKRNEAGKVVSIKVAKL